MNEDKLKEILGTEFEKIQATDEDIIRIANYLGCTSKDVSVCRAYIKEHYFKSKDKDAHLH